VLEEEITTGYKHFYKDSRRSIYLKWSPTFVREFSIKFCNLLLGTLMCVVSSKLLVQLVHSTTVRNPRDCCDFRGYYSLSMLIIFLWFPNKQLRRVEKLFLFGCCNLCSPALTSIIASSFKIGLQGGKSS
jgi:hypothetical protein